MAAASAADACSCASWAWRIFSMVALITSPRMTQTGMTTPTERTKSSDATSDKPTGKRYESVAGTAKRIDVPGGCHMPTHANTTTKYTP